MSDKIPTNIFSEIAETFKRNVGLVHELTEFDRIVLEFAIKTLEGVEASATRSKISPDHPQNVNKALKQIRTIRENDSFRPKYQHIFNQCIVLLVSYFASAVQDIFEQCVSEMVKAGRHDNLMNEKLEFTVSELSEIGAELHNHLGELLVTNKKKSISFQDMQSIARAFETYCGYLPQRNEDVNNIIVGQACRHVIVHSGSIVDRQCTGQVSKAIPRKLKTKLVNGQPIQFDVPEVKILSDSMIRYVDTLISNLMEQLGVKV